MNTHEMNQYIPDWVANQEENTIPRFPFQMHIPREGEPPYFSYTQKPVIFRGKHPDIETFEQDRWVQWAMAQPDSDVLIFEAGLWIDWYQYYDPAVKKDRWWMEQKDRERHMKEELIRVFNLVREQCEGIDIDRYWIHLFSQEN